MKRTKVPAELETVIMKEVWKRREATVRDVHEALYPQRKMAYTTVLTTMQNLEKKGFLQRKASGRTHIYSPQISAKTVKQNVLRDILDRLFDGSKVDLVNALFEEETLTKEEFERLRKSILERRKQEEQHE